MASQVPQLFDPVKRQSALARAKRMGPERFLLDRACEDLIDRLDYVKRQFSTPLDFGTPEGAFAEALKRVRPPEAGLPAGHIAWQGETDVPVPLDAEAFDLIVSGMQFHVENDLPGLMLRLRRALKPDGLMIAAFPGGDTLHELRDALLSAEAEISGGAAMRIFPMIDVRTAGMLLQRAGFALPVTDSEKIMVRYSSLARLISDLRAMASTAILLERKGSPPLTRAIIARTAEIYGERHADSDGKLRATFEFVWMSGWAPHESQQKPLKPGSAKSRLSDALKSIRKSGPLS